MGMIYTATAPIAKGLLSELRTKFHQDVKYGALFDIFMFCGPRAMEVLRLKVSHVAIPVSKFEWEYVDNTCKWGETKWGHKYQYEVRDNILLYTTKQDRGNKRTKRTPPINPLLKASLGKYLDGTLQGPDDYLFIGNNGNPLSYEAINRRLEKYCAELRIDDTVLGGQIGYHMIRKAFAVSLFQHFGGGLTAAIKVQREFGHSNLLTTYRYLGVNIEEDVHEAIKTGAMYNVTLVDRIQGREASLVGWQNLYTIFENSGVLDLQMTNWLRTFTSDEADIDRTLQWMKSHNQKIDFL
jgi:integrase